MKFKIQVSKFTSRGSQSCRGIGACMGHTNGVDSAGCDSAEILDFLQNRKITMALIIDRLSPL